MIRRDYRSKPVRRLVVMGESNAYGMCAGDPLNEWVQALAFLIRRFTEGPLRVFNNAIPANVISPRAPGYDPDSVCGTAPSALERFEQAMIDYQPDLAVYAYGLTASRLHDDTCHFTDRGQWLIGQTVFAVLAASCSFLAEKSINDFREAGLGVPTTGGTNALPHVIRAWRRVGR